MLSRDNILKLTIDVGSLPDNGILNRDFKYFQQYIKTMNAMIIFICEQEHLISDPMRVLYLFSSLSLKMNDKGPFCPTKNKVILEETSKSLII